MTGPGFVVIGVSTKNKGSGQDYWSPGLKEVMYYLDRELSYDFVNYGTINIADWNGKNRDQGIRPEDLYIRIEKPAYERTYDFDEMNRMVRRAEQKLRHQTGNYVWPTMVLFTYDGRSIADKKNDYLILPDRDDSSDVYKLMDIFVGKHKQVQVDKRAA